MLNLRPYQRAATDAAKDWLKVSIEPAIIDAAPAAGKSFMVAEIAHWLSGISGGKRVLCLQPNSKLVKQNLEKFLITGEPASVFSASAGGRSTRHKVVFATPLTVKNSISRFCQTGQCGYAGVIIDECHEITPTIKAIISEMRESNPNLRVLGLTGTPYRLGTGYIFRIWPDDRTNGDDTCRDPYFLKCVYRVSAREMLDQEFITPMEVSEINATSYDTSGIELLPNGTLNHSTVERAFEGHGRRTAAIVADVLAQAHAKQVRGGIMYFAATVKHAEEIMASLPPENSAMSTGDKGILCGKDATDDQIVKAYRAGKFKHLVSVAKYTTGFDVSHTEVIALLRYTESAALLQQILGRAWRLDDVKPKCYLLDYANNVEKHFPDGDIYNPEIKAGRASGPAVPIDAECPDCHHVNEFGLQPDYADYQRDHHGYALDVFGQPLMNDHGQIPVHYGRRCFGIVPIGKGKFDRCNYRWNGKPCPSCDEPNDIAARYCYICKAEIVNPNDKLIADFKAMKRDPTQPQTDRVISIATSEGESARGNKTLRVDFVTSYRQFSIWLMPEAQSARAINDWKRWERVDGSPKTVSYVKESESSFYRVLAYNHPADDEDLPQEADDDKQLRSMKNDGERAARAAKDVATKAKKAEKEERFNVMKDIFSEASA